MDNNNSKNKFKPDHRIFSICTYAVITTTICAGIIKCIWSWEDTSAFLSSLGSNLSPFAVGLFIAYIMSNLTTSIQEHLFTNTIKMKDGLFKTALSLIMSYAVVAAIIAGSLFFIIPSLIASFSDISSNVPIWYENLTNLVNNILSYLPEQVSDAINDYFANNSKNGMLPSQEKITEIITTFAPNIASASVSVLKLVFNAFVAIVVSVYMIIDKDKLYNGFLKIIYSVFSKPRAEYIEKTIVDANDIFSGFIIGKTLDSLIIGFLTLAILLIFNVGGAYKVIISIFIGITNMIPYFGPIFGAVPCFIIILLSVSPKQALIFIVIIICIQQFDGNILGPYILGDKTGLRPIWIIFAITVGGWLGGVVGMFLGVPFTAVIINIINERMELRLKNKDITRFDDSEKEHVITEKIKGTVSKIVENAHKDDDNK